MVAGFFQDLAFSASLTMVVYFILSKLRSSSAEDITNVTCNSRNDVFIYKAGFLEHVGEKYPGVFDIRQERNLGNSGFQAVMSGEVHSVDGEGNELKQEKKDNNTNDEALGGVVENVLVQEAREEKDSVGVGGGEDIKEKEEVDECSESRPMPQETEEELQSLVEEAYVALSLREEFEVREGKDEEICEVLENKHSQETERDAAQSTERSEGNESNDQVGVEESEEGLFDDWEGIERSELEKHFDAAVAFVGSKGNADRIDGNTRMQLYGLHRVAMEGTCHGPQPMALKVSARAKRNAWQKLGDMSSEMAMERYMALLSASIPEWEDKIIKK
ncbi:acyl-CoA-binding domain-containing protein 3-like isoform X1 [Coffea eugenioides]|uniref:acyl-CoA-binding domain-containing protein 3-like isoform X1 n=1 Tax=Coffea eugenioides TaxID=49369 RepID=UPI000F60B7FA|nr:acyl-CoA-binding domain-containing protein 3-like isoform X1 [Coffea eugenioides]